MSQPPSNDLQTAIERTRAALKRSREASEKARAAAEHASQIKPTKK